MIKNDENIIIFDGKYKDGKDGLGKEKNIMN